MKTMNCLAATTALLAASWAQAAPYSYSYNFNDGTIPAVFSGAGSISGAQGFEGVGNPGNKFSGKYLRNDSMGGHTVLTLTNLPNHWFINLDFLLAVIDSWDGNNAQWGPDRFNVKVDGQTIFSETFSQSTANQTYAGAPLVAPADRAWNGGWDDSAYDMAAEPVFEKIPHIASTLKIEWFASGAGWQGGMDESFALDNVRINLIPEPGMLALLAVGLTALGACLRPGRR